MRQVVDVLRLTHEQHRSQREIAQSLGLAQSTVSEYRRRFAASGLPWPLPPELDEAALEARLFRRVAGELVATRPVPDWAAVQQELKERKGVTLQLLWAEYKQRHRDGYQYTQFCRHYHAWAARLEPVLRQVYVAGEKVFVDYAGPTVPITDPATGETRDAQVFVGALGASHLLYVEATWTQGLADWIGAHVRLLEYLGGAPALIVPDNVKTGVHHACYYEPTLHPTYQDFAAHYSTAILPTRSYHPRDKAKVETAVQIVEREILAPLRHDVFHSLVELNYALIDGRERVNARPFQKLAGSRRELFAQLDRPALKPLPAERYELAEWRTAKVNIDYHIAVDRHLYSVPYALVGAEVRVRLTSSMVEVLHQGKRVALHVRAIYPEQRGRFTTDPGHRPKSHQAHLEWSPSRLIRWGEQVGTATGAVVQTILERYPHPEQGYRACLGLLSLARRYGAARLEAASARARTTGAVSYRSVKSILESGFDQLPPELTDGAEPTLRLPAAHAHVRGPDYYRAALTGDGAEAPAAATRVPPTLFPPTGGVVPC
jgi:transposase